MKMKQIKLMTEQVSNGVGLTYLQMRTSIKYVGVCLVTLSMA